MAWYSLWLGWHLKWKWLDWAICDKSVKFGILIAKGILKRFRDGDILNFQHGAHSSHFSKWLPPTTVFLWVMDVIWYFWLICHTNLHRDVFWTVEHCHWIFKMAAILPRWLLIIKFRVNSLKFHAGKKYEKKLILFKKFNLGLNLLHRNQYVSS